MKLTAPFNLNPLSKFHVPLPRTPRQSQQLLNALTSSFRRELDRAHPPTASSSDEGSGTNNAYSGDHLNEEHAHSAAHATDKHIRALLDNPLFRVSPSRNSVRSGPQSSTDGSRIQKEPMAIFDELVASGSATVGSVSDCLNWQLLLASRQSGERFVKELRDSRAGSRTFSWWSSSDPSTRVSFLKNNRAVRSTCKFMAAEGLRDSILAWLRVLRNRDFGGFEVEEDLAEKSFKYILGNFLNGEIECGGGLVSALRFYLDACKILMSTADETPTLPLKKSLGAPAGYLLSMIEMNSRRNPSDSIPADVYDKYANMVSALALESSASHFKASRTKCQRDGFSLGKLTLERAPRLESDNAYPKLCFGAFSAHCLPYLRTCSPRGREGDRGTAEITITPQTLLINRLASFARLQIDLASTDNHFSQDAFNRLIITMSSTPSIAALVSDSVGSPSINGAPHQKGNSHPSKPVEASALTKTNDENSSEIRAPANDVSSVSMSESKREQAKAGEKRELETPSTTNPGGVESTEPDYKKPRTNEDAVVADSTSPHSRTEKADPGQAAPQQKKKGGRPRKTKDTVKKGIPTDGIGSRTRSRTKVVP
ncbi:uncharacterized protein BDW70DRAFT_148962 [Aspergillus foveolatus]|uniref:uncharacterized protein n=1 Tax=Aspergillus foveolatus TaxID=210207 RepID=UPI003CCD7199